MYSRKSVEPRMEPWGTLVLTRYSCKNFSSRTTWNRLFLRKDKIRPNIRPKTPWDLCLWRRPACQILSKALDISIATALYNCQKIYSWLIRSKTILEIRKKATFLWLINNSIIHKFFKDFTNHRKKTNRAVVFSCTLFPSILKYKDH